jgi:hypothetical protein
MLKELLGRYVDSDPSSLRFGSQARGKPTLRGAPGAVVQPLALGITGAVCT